MNRATLNRADGRANKPANGAAMRDYSRRDAPRTRNGKVRLRSFDQLDGRTHAAIKARKLIRAIEADLGGAGALSAAQRALAARAGMMSAIVEDCEIKWLQREDVSLSEYGTLVDRMRRILESLGLVRAMRDVSPAPAGVDMTGRALEIMESL
jgi:phage-related minor tail protein